MYNRKMIILCPNSSERRARTAVDKSLKPSCWLSLSAYRFNHCRLSLLPLHLLSFQHLRSLIQSTISLKYTELIRSSRTPDGQLLLVSLLTPIRKQCPCRPGALKHPHHHPAQPSSREPRSKQHHLPSSLEVKKLFP